jgi:hypothetical protein
VTQFAVASLNAEKISLNPASFDHPLELEAAVPQPPERELVRIHVAGRSYPILAKRRPPFAAPEGVPNHPAAIGARPTDGVEHQP